MITTRRTWLRPPAADDAALLAPILGDPVTMSFWPQPLDATAVGAWVQRSVAAYSQHGLGRWVILERTTGAVIGDCGILPSTLDGAPVWDLGYIVHHPFWRQGFAVECARAYLAYAQTLGVVDRVSANMPDDHRASWRTAEALGFQYVRSFANPRNRNILTRVYTLEWYRLSSAPA